MKRILALILTILILLGLTFAWKTTMNSVEEYNEYKAFCKERPTFCRCSWGDCTFKSPVSGFSQDTQDLCELADLLDDEKMIFEVGCE